MSGLVTIGVSTRFRATHVCAEEHPHPHDWQVTARFRVPARTDARVLRAALEAIIAPWRDGALPAQLEWSEDIAAAIGAALQCHEVVVSREEDGIEARWPS